MFRNRGLFLAAGVASLAVTTGWATDSRMAPSPSTPTKAPEIKPADFSKYVVESPTKKLVEKTEVTTAPADRFANPKVEPGKVRWHTDFDAACKAAKQSGKPVLLFQMMGRLDEKFC